MAKKKKSETEIFEEQLQKINEKKIKFSEEIYEKYHTIELKKLEERIQENYTGNRFEREEQGGLGSVIVRVIVIVVAGRTVRHGRSVLHCDRHRCDCRGGAGAIASTAVVAVVGVVQIAARRSGGADHHRRVSLLCAYCGNRPG